MGTKTKIFYGLAILAMTIVLAVGSVVAVWTLSQQRVTSVINVEYVSVQVVGSATAQWRVGESDTWHSMTTDGTTSGKTQIKFELEKVNSDVLKPTAETLTLTEDADYVVFKYTFTNEADNDYAVALTYSNDDEPDSNMKLFAYATDEAIESGFTTKITTPFSTSYATSVSKSKPHYVYVIVQVNDPSEDSLFSGTFNFNLDGRTQAG